MGECVILLYGVRWLVTVKPTERCVQYKHNFVVESAMVNDSCSAYSSLLEGQQLILHIRKAS